MQIFGFFGSILGYLLWFLFLFFKNFAVSIVFFTIIIRFVIFPFSIKQQKSMASTARLQKKQKEIKEKYANNRQKANEEMQKLYQKEGVSPTGGCLTSIVPMIIMLGIFYCVAYPLTNTLHINADVIDTAKVFVSSVPGHPVLLNASTYQEMDLMNTLEKSPDLVYLLFNSTDAANIEMFVKGFNLSGFNLLKTPQMEGFTSVYIIIPILCLASSIGAQIVTMKVNNTGQNQQGCMKAMMFGLPLFSAYISFVVPAAVGFYWICSSLFSLVQSLIMGKLFGPNVLIAKSEAQHVALLEQQEAKVEYSYAPAYSNDNSKNDNKKNKK